MSSQMDVQQVVRSGEFYLACNVEDAFPMFSPEGERAWVRGWNPRPVFPDTAEFARDTVFRQGEGEDDAIWTIVDVDRERHRAEYVRVAPDSHTAHIVVKVDPVDSKQSHVRVKYALTTFGKGSTSLLDQFSEDAYAERMRNWQRQITECLERRVES